MFSPGRERRAFRSFGRGIVRHIPSRHTEDRRRGYLRCHTSDNHMQNQRCYAVSFARDGKAVRPLSRAFTLIEILVVVGIIGLLLGLILPAVQAARETARRVQCMSNLRQIGIGMHTYESTHHMFPTGALADRHGIGTNSLSPLTFLLQDVDEQPLYNSINMSFATVEDLDFPTVENHTARNTRVALFLCPSDGEPIHLNSYRFNQGNYQGKQPYLFDGPFGFRVKPSQATVTDGLSNTAFVSERLSGSFYKDASDPRREVKSPVLTSYFPNDDTLILYCLDAPTDYWFTSSGRYWMISGIANTNYNHNGQPNDRRPSCTFVYVHGIVLGPGGLSPPRSNHASCVNVLFGDGHTRTVSDTIQPSVWKSLGTYNAGDLVE